MKRLKEINNLYNYVDYVEFYEEFTKSKVYNFVDSKLDDIITNNYKGLGVRLLKDDTVFYLATNKKYDFNEIIIHPRLRSDFYKNNIHLPSFT